ncbi:Imm1 family immunity protein [Dactylosporangium sp. NPDC000244]|uniref:Imm1 family immunity protein n=1 Tax=Dactylosporangium sp. NPDC000244 TaxID=3154365 RepID=UPI00331990AA
MDDVVTLLRSDGRSADSSHVALLMLAERRHTSEIRDWWPDNYLQVSINPDTGFGGLIWWVSPSRAAATLNEDDEFVWVLNNPEPPSIDPRVVADPGFVSLFSPRSVLPIPQLRSVLEEFCSVGTGDRPRSVEWAKGDLSGRRLDEDGVHGV